MHYTPAQADDARHSAAVARTRTRRWNVSLPAFFAMYLFAAIRPASRDSDDSCSFSQLVSQESSVRGASLQAETAAMPCRHAAHVVRQQRGRQRCQAAADHGSNTAGGPGWVGGAGRAERTTAAPHEVDATGEDIDAGLLGAGVENADFGVRHTAVEARLRVRLVLDLAVALVGTCTSRAIVAGGGRRNKHAVCGKPRQALPTTSRVAACKGHGGGGNHSRRPMATTSVNERVQMKLRGFRFLRCESGQGLRWKALDM